MGIALNEALTMSAKSSKVKEESYEKYLTNQFNNESKWTNSNQKLLEANWTKLLDEQNEKLKSQKLGKLEGHFRHIVEEKKKAVASMLESLNEDENQRVHFQQRHLQKLRDIENLYQKMVLEVYTRYIEQVTSLHISALQFKGKSEEDQQNQLKRLEYINYLINQNQSNEEMKKKIDFRGWKDELKNKMYEEMNIASSKYEAELNAYRNKILAVESDYEREALKYRAQYDMLLRKDNESVEIITKQHTRIKELQDDINGLKEHLQEFNKDEVLRDTEIKDIKTSIYAILQRMKSETFESLNSLNSKTKKTLVKLHNSLGELKQLESTVTKILEQHYRLKKISQESLAQICDKRLCLQAKKTSLEEKFEALKGSLKDFLSGISVDNESEKVNPLLIIN